MTSLTSVTLDAPDPAAATLFYETAFGLGDRVRIRAAATAPTGFRGCTLSLVVPGPGTVDALVDAAVGAGATVLKPRAKSLWGYGGVLRAPDGAIWKIATPAKQDPGPVTRRIDQVVLLLGVADVAASRRWYVEHGLTVKRSFGRVYAEFDAAAGEITLALYRRRALAKDAGVPDDGDGGHGLTLGGDLAGSTDPDGFVWQPGLAVSTP